MLNCGNDFMNDGNKVIIGDCFGTLPFSALVFGRKSLCKFYDSNVLILTKSRRDESLIMGKHFIDFVNGRD